MEGRRWWIASHGRNCTTDNRLKNVICYNTYYWLLSYTVEVIYYWFTYYFYITFTNNNNNTAQLDNRNSTNACPWTCQSRQSPMQKTLCIYSSLSSVFDLLCPKRYKRQDNYKLHCICKVQQLIYLYKQNTANTAWVFTESCVYFTHENTCKPKLMNVHEVCILFTAA